MFKDETARYYKFFTRVAVFAYWGIQDEGGKGEYDNGKSNVQFKWFDDRLNLIS